MSLPARQLMWTWLVGSVSVGTLAVLFTFDRGTLAIRPLSQLAPISLLGVLGMLIALFTALGLLAWGTPAATWLPDHARGGALWVVVVGVGGLTGCGFAAAATFAGDFSLAAQLILGYLGGGLPFALMAAVLLKPPRANAAALGIIVLLLLIGVVIMEGQPVTACAELLWQLLGPPVTVR